MYNKNTWTSNVGFIVNGSYWDMQETILLKIYSERMKPTLKYVNYVLFFFLF